jgi:hypothetical protein
MPPPARADERASGIRLDYVDPVYDDRLLTAAQRVLDGDDSANAVSALEGVLLDDYPGDERFEDLLEALALYAPGMGPPYLGRTEIRDAIRQAMVAIDAEK